jgi:hypothetical protein
VIRPTVASGMIPTARKASNNLVPSFMFLNILASSIY